MKIEQIISINQPS